MPETMRKYVNFAAKSFIAIFLFMVGCTSPKTEKTTMEYDFPFQNPELSTDERIDDLISRLTLEEKVSQMMHESPEIERLGIPAYNWWNECLHGVARAGSATVFPQAIGMGATFDDQLINRVSTAISDEARAMYHAAARLDNRVRYAGLTFWTPNVNIFRDPRWGRGMETYGEDPYLMSKMGVSFVKGLQGDDPNYLKAAACGKHFVVHSGPEALRHEFNAVSNQKDMNETYFPAFKALVQEAEVEAIMCAYNRTNGDPCCGSDVLLNQILRDQWGFEGHIVSDCWGIIDFYDGHNVVETPEEAAAMAVRSGVNLNCGSTFDPHLLEAVQMGLITEEEIDERLATLLRTRFKLGLFDPYERNPYAEISTDVINSEAHQKLAREVAQKSIVVLKNDQVLPLAKDTRSVFVLGPNANNVEVLIGNYYGVSPNMSTILEGLASKVAPGCMIQYKKGFMLDRPNINPIDWTSPDAKQADVSIMVMGISPMIEGEEGEAIASPHKGDRLDYNLPPNQIEFLKRMREDNDKPIIAVITGGSPMNLKEVHEIADAVVLAWYPGEQGGNAVADIIFGDVNPSGRLPITFPESIDQLPPFDDYDMPGRTYRYMSAKPMYPFGYGLSYTDFRYEDVTINSNELQAGETTEVNVTVKNIGRYDGEEVVQLYLTLPDKGYQNPLYSLKGFKRVALQPGESKEVSFTLTPDLMESVTMEGEFVIEQGEYLVKVGGSSPHERSLELGMPGFEETQFTVSK